MRVIRRIVGLAGDVAWAVMAFGFVLGAYLWHGGDDMDYDGEYY